MRDNSFCRFSTFAGLLLLGILAGGSLARGAEYMVADRAANRIVALDATTGAYIRTVATLGTDEPSAIVVGPEGKLLVASPQSTLIKAIDPQTGQSETYIDLSALFNSPPPESTQGGPSGLLYNPANGDLFVSQLNNGAEQFNGSRIARYDENKNLIGILGLGSAPTGRGGMALDAAGNLYVSTIGYPTTLSEVMKFTAASDYAVSSTFASGFQLPLAPSPVGIGFNGMAFDETGNLFVAALFTQVIARFEASGTVSPAGQIVGSQAYPSGVALDPDGSIIVSGLGNNNPGDPIYGNLLFPGTINRINPATFESLPFLRGDYDSSALVDGGDLLAWQRTSTSPARLTEWRQGYGNAGVQGPFQPTSLAYYELSVAAAGVPEPAAIAVALGLAAAGTAAKVLRRARREKSTRPSNVNRT